MVNSFPDKFTVDYALDHINTGPFHYVLLALTGFCWTAQGMEMLILSFIKQPLQCAWGIDDRFAALITTAVAFGMLLGATFWGALADHIGRKNGAMLSCLFIAITGFLSAISANPQQMLLSRGLVGFGIGGNPIFFSLLLELLPSKRRGAWSISLALFWSLGAVVESFVAMFVLPAYGWRAFIAVSTIPAAFSVVTCLLLPESPHWLIANNRIGEARAVLAQVAQTNHAELPPGDLQGSLSPMVYQDAREDETAPLCEPAPSKEDESPPATGHVNSDVAPDRATVSSPVIIPSRGAAVASLWRKEVRLTMGAMLMLWFLSAFLYYGLVVLQPELLTLSNNGARCAANEERRTLFVAACGALASLEKCEGDPRCVPGADATCLARALVLEDGGGVSAHNEKEERENACGKELTRGDFLATAWASVGELPGVLAAFALVDVVGRRAVIGDMFAVSTLLFVALGTCLSRSVEAGVFFMLRGLSLGSFQAVFVLSTELYPASVRSSLMGLSSSVARVGMVVTPFVGQYLVDKSLMWAIGIYTAMAAVGVWATAITAVETTGRALFGSAEELAESVRRGRQRINEAGCSGGGFKTEPGVGRIIRLLRWRAVVDGADDVQRDEVTDGV